MLIITSVLLIASMLPNIYPFTSELSPVVIDVTRIPIASAVLEIRAIAASPWILLLSLILKSRNAEITTTGTEIASGATFIASAMQSAPNPTCESPSPIIEYRFKTSVTPSKAAQRATSTPTIIALRIKP